VRPTSGLKNWIKRRSRSLGNFAIERCLRPPVAGCQVTVFLLRGVCPCQRSCITTVHRWCSSPTRVCAVTTPLRSLNELNWQLVDESVNTRSGRINRLLFAHDLVLLESSEHGLQHVLYRFSAPCIKPEWKSALKNRYYVSPDTQGSVYCKWGAINCSRWRR